MSRASDLKTASERLKTLPKGNYSPKRSRSFNLSDGTVDKLKALSGLKNIGMSELITKLIDADYTKNASAVKLYVKAHAMIKD
jgi:hypothetical protein